MFCVNPDMKPEIKEALTESLTKWSEAERSLSMKGSN
jgi:hypothetical protein